MAHLFAPPTRSQLFVPADRPQWYEKAMAVGPDALILDLEDAVATNSKTAARSAVAGFLADSRKRPVTLVRVNERESRHFLDDVLVAVEAGADGILLPKVAGPEDVIAVAALVDAAERRCGREDETTVIVPLLETPRAIRGAFQIAEASRRVAYMGGLTIQGGDIEGGIGFRWSPEGAETIAWRTSILIDARAAGVPSPVTGVWGDVADLDGLRRFAEQGRSLGYEGMAVIHPSHVPVVNDVFAPGEDELDRDRRLIEAMEEAERSGTASIRFDGQMVDLAMVERARTRLEKARTAER
ncbi:MAG: CoA ester lyase [Actinobacteria bacterium]|nr:CoA ester lyase [Actinomycetota bacterium]